MQANPGASDSLAWALDAAIIRQPLIVPPDTPAIAAIAQITTAPSTPHSNSVIVVDHLTAPPTVVGIFTTSDALRFSSQPPTDSPDTPRDRLPIQQVMTHPVITLAADQFTDPAVALRLMEQHQIHHLPLVDSQQQLVGLLTQASLQHSHTLLLQTQIQQLQTHCAKLVEQHQQDIQTQVRAQVQAQVTASTATLESKLRYNQFLATVGSQIRASLNLHDVLEIAVQELRSLLDCEQVAIYQLRSGTGGTLLTAATRAPNESQQLPLPIELVTLDSTTEGEVRIPITVQQQLWGVMQIQLVPQADSSHRLSREQMDLLRQLTSQLAIAIQQSTSYHKAKVELEERKQVELRLRESQQRYATLVAAVPVGIFRTDATGQCTYVNDRYCNITGLRPETAAGQGWRQRLHPDDQDRIDQEWQQAMQENRPFRLEYRFQQTDGSVVWVYGQMVAEQDASGRVVGYVGSITDISDRKRSEEALQQSEAHLRALINALPDLIMRVNRDGVYLEFVATPNFPVVGSLPDMVGSHVSATLPLKEANRRMRFIHQALTTNTIQIYEQDLSIHGHTQVEEVRVVPYGQDEVLLLVRDISEAKQAERSLQESEAKYRLLVENQTDLLVKVDLDGRLTFVSPSYCQMFGKTETELLNQPYLPLVHEDDRERTEQSRLALRRPPYTCYLEQRVMTQDGWRWLGWSSQAILDDQGHVIATVGVGRDISQLKQTQHALRQLNQELERRVAERTAELQASETQIRAMIEAIPDLLLRVTRSGECLDYVHSRNPNDSFLPIRQHLSEVLPPHLLHQQLAMIDRAILTGQLQVYEHEFVKYGQQIYEEVRVVAISPSEALIIVRDVTARKQMESALRESEEKFRQLAEVVDAVFWILNLDRTERIYVSPAYERIWGRSCLDLHISPDAWLDAIHPDDRDRMIAAIPKQLCGEFDEEYRIIRPDDTIRWIRDRAFPIRNDQGEVYRIAGIAEDITDQKEAAAQLQRSNQELARATRMKDEFLANMSHELRTPLNAILGMAEGLQEEVFGQINIEQRRALQTIERSGFHLLELINDILDVAKIESGQIELTRTATPVASLCKNSLTFIKQQAMKKGIQLETRIPNVLPDLLVDERRVRQVLINLLNNAVKFTPEGGRITLEVLPSPDTLHREKGDEGFLRLAVRDTGIGIDPENMDKLFQPFIQIDSALNRQYQGTGLGLALVKQIVDLHGGQVGLTSQVGVGSCFTVDLPCVAASATSGTVEVPSDSEAGGIASGVVGSKVDASGAIAAELNWESTTSDTLTAPLILLVEDNTVNVRTVSSYLKAKGYRILIASNGEDAIALTHTHRPDLILMDIQMPGMDGLEATQQIRAIPEAANTPIIALTALAMEGDRDRCFAAGVNDYLTKPVRLKQLTNVIQQFLVEGVSG